MTKMELIEKLSLEKASVNNTINLHDYTVGLSEMYDVLENKTKRFAAACMAIQGFLSNPTVLYKDNPLDIIVESSYKIADEMLKQEGEK